MFPAYHNRVSKVRAEDTKGKIHKNSDPGKKKKQNYRKGGPQSVNWRDVQRTEGPGKRNQGRRDKRDRRQWMPRRNVKTSVHEITSFIFPNNLFVLSHSI